MMLTKLCVLLLFWNYLDVVNSIIELPKGILYITRQDWNASEPNKIRPLKTPVPYVIISHTGYQPECISIEDCGEHLRAIQINHKKRFNDIGYNFLIGGDGNVYELRGWKVENFHTNFQNRSIGIAFSGDYRYDELTKKQITAMDVLIQVGIKYKKIQNSYILLPMNATYNTISPGENVVKVIEQSPHYSNASFLYLGD